MSDWKETLMRAREKLIAATAGAVGKVMPAPMSENEKLQNEFKVAKARNYVDQKATPAAFWLENNEPAMHVAAKYIRAANRPGGPVEDGGEIDEPPQARQPVQMQREFSNDAEKEAYLERIRTAMANAKKATVNRVAATPGAEAIDSWSESNGKGKADAEAARERDPVARRVDLANPLLPARLKRNIAEQEEPTPLDRSPSKGSSPYKKLWYKKR